MTGEFESRGTLPMKLADSTISRGEWMERFVVISGCSGGGKSTLLTELGRRGYSIVEEPGRRIVKQQLQQGGAALPWKDGRAFARRAIAMALEDRAAAAALNGWVFFDRDLVDAAAALQHLTGDPILTAFAQEHRYHQTVFLTPPWPEIYINDPERRHGIEAAEAEYSRLLEIYPMLGYKVSILSKVSVSERADFIEGALAEPPSSCI
jgi:predicted ATPase